MATTVKTKPKSPMAFDDESYVSPEIVQRFKEKFWRVHPRDADRLSRDAVDWFRKRVSKDLSIKADRLIRAPEYKKKTGTENRQLLGKMYLYAYEAVSPGDAEHDVYDAYPLVFFFSARNIKGKLVLYGLNMHYLTPRNRMLLFMKLLQLRSSKETRPGMRLKLTWQLIKSIASHALFEPAVHAYRVDRLRSRLLEVPAQDWSVVVFLQLQKWVALGDSLATQSGLRRRMTTKGKKLKI